MAVLGTATPTPPKFAVSEVANVGSVATGSVVEDTTPRLWGIPLKYISLVTLAVQNASLAIIMHYSRISTPPSRTYSAATAVLMNELLKGSISLAIAFSRLDDYGAQTQQRRGPLHVQSGSWFHPRIFCARCRRLTREVFSPDCWKLSIPAILYVIQNNLQFVAASNLEAATFQVTYQMKILTTAAFSVLLLRRKLNSTKWLALLALAIGVGIVQIQSTSGNSSSSSHSEHIMHPFKGFMAVAAACFTSGLAGVYFEMVLKGSQADLWVRNVQLSLFSLLPALVPVFASQSATPLTSAWFSALFANFGAWAWGTVAVQVFGGLVTAIVIKYSDNILKGFATSLSIVLSFLASVALFDFYITPSFLLGSATVLAATWMYNQPESKAANAVAVASSAGTAAGTAFTKLMPGMMTPRKSSYPGSPVESDAPILGETDEKRRSLGMSMGASPRVLAAALKLVTPRTSQENLAGHNETLDGTIYSLSRTGSASSLADFHASSVSLSSNTSPYISRVHSPGPAASTPPRRVHSGGVHQLAAPPLVPRVSNGQLHPSSAENLPPTAGNM